MAMSKMRVEGKGYLPIAIVYLLGLFIGALDTGIVTPARTVIQSGLGVGDQVGVWMITIYTLAYAAAIPVMGKLADRYGRKGIYLVSISLFGVGSLFSGLAQDVGSFNLLIVARAVQAIGGGGIMPVATAEFGTAFPPAKRGMALGLVGGVYGLANVFGASAGSLILSIVGTQNWQFIFYVNIPICLVIMVVGVFVLPKRKEKVVAPIDGLGIGVLIAMVLSLLYGLRNLDFFHFTTSVTTVGVYPFLIIFAILVPVFIAVEKRASDPVMNLSYFKNVSIVITLILAAITGVVMMGMIFIPQFSENALRMAAGSGGYFVIILGLFAGVGAPISGKLIDRLGVKRVLGVGLIASIAGSLFLAFVATKYPNYVTVIISLVLIGIGMGFTMGTPLNYMMLSKTKESESNSALATLSLVRSIGTAVAPAIMVAFLSHAGASIQANMMQELPAQISVPVLPSEQAFDKEVAQIKSVPSLKGLVGALDLPDITTLHTTSLQGGAGVSTGSGTDTTAGGSKDASAPSAGKSADAAAGDGSKPDDGAGRATTDAAAQVSGTTPPQGLSPQIQEELQNADVTTIAKDTSDFAGALLNGVGGMLTQRFTASLERGLTGVEQVRTQVDAKLASEGSSSGTATSKLQSIDAVLSTLHDQLQAMQAGVPHAIDLAKQEYLGQVKASGPTIENMFQKTMDGGFQGLFILVGICSAAGLVLLVFYRTRRV